MEITSENIININTKLKNKIFICRQASAQNMVDEDDNEFHVDVVTKNVKPNLTLFQLGNDWIKCKFDNGQTYLYDIDFSMSQMFEKYKMTENLDFTQFQESIAKKLSKNTESRFQSCKSCTLNNIVNLHSKDDLNTIFTYVTNFIEDMRNSTEFIATESIVSRLQEMLNFIFDTDFNLIDENNIIILKINGFPTAFYTLFDITQVGNIEFNRAIDPILWFGQILENESENLDDKMTAL